jgi:hypothetical protein
MARHAPVRHPIPGTGLQALDPFGGLAAAASTVHFAVEGPAAARAAVARVEWRVDGTLAHTDATPATFSWGNASVRSGIGLGRHTITVTAVGRDGSAASTSFALTVTTCGFVSFAAFMPESPARGRTELGWDSADRSDAGPALTGVSARVARNVVSALPTAVRGRDVGTLTVEHAGAPPQSWTLHAPRRGTALLGGRGTPRVVLHPGATEFLTITALPTGTQAVSLTLRPPGTRLVHAVDPCRMALVRGVLRSGTQTASAVHGGRYVCRPGATTPD